MNPRLVEFLNGLIKSSEIANALAKKTNDELSDIIFEIIVDMDAGSPMYSLLDEIMWRLRGYEGHQICARCKESKTLLQFDASKLEIRKLKLVCAECLGE